jgi:hypothetical protein
MASAGCERKAFILCERPSILRLFLGEARCQVKWQMLRFTTMLAEATNYRYAESAIIIHSLRAETLAQPCR